MYTKQLPRPTAEIEQLRAQQPPAEQSLPNPVKGKRFDDTWGAARSQGRRHEGVDILLRKTRRYAVPRPASSPKSGATDWAVKLSVFKGRVRGITTPTSINLPVSVCMNE